MLAVSTATVLLWEKGRASPTIRPWPAIIEFLGYDPCEEPTTTGGRLRALRRRRGWTQKELARELGVDPTALQSWEGGGEPRMSWCKRAVAAILAEAACIVIAEAEAGSE